MRCWQQAAAGEAVRTGPHPPHSHSAAGRHCRQAVGEEPQRPEAAPLVPGLPGHMRSQGPQAQGLLQMLHLAHSGLGHSELYFRPLPPLQQAEVSLWALRIPEAPDPKQ